MVWPCVFGLPGHAMQEKGAAGYGLGMFFGASQADKQAPPVINQGDEAACQAAPFEVFGGKSTPAPLVFQFVKTVFTVGPITIELGNGENFQRQ